MAPHSSMSVRSNTSSPLASPTARPSTSSPTPSGRRSPDGTASRRPLIKPFRSLNGTFADDLNVSVGSRLGIDARSPGRKGLITINAINGVSDTGLSSPHDWQQHGRLVETRSNLLPPPLGSPGAVWGHFDSIDDVLSRPLPLPPIPYGQWKTMGLHGGQFSRYTPISSLYEVSKRSCVTPGPGLYGDCGDPDPSISTRSPGIGKGRGGRMSSMSERITDADHRAKTASKVPGPGYYDTDHLFGIYKRIRMGTPALSDTELSNLHSLTSTLEDSIFDQRLVMSRTMPLDALMKLGTTRFSRKLKESHAPQVRKLARLPRPQTKTFKQRLEEEERERLRSMSRMTDDDDEAWERWEEEEGVAAHG